MCTCLSTFENSFTNTHTQTYINVDTNANILTINDPPTHMKQFIRPGRKQNMFICLQMDMFMRDVHKSTKIDKIDKILCVYENDTFGMHTFINTKQLFRNSAKYLRRGPKHQLSIFYNGEVV